VRFASEHFSTASETVDLFLVAFYDPNVHLILCWPVGWLACFLVNWSTGVRANWQADRRTKPTYSSVRLIPQYFVRLASEHFSTVSSWRFYFIGIKIKTHFFIIIKHVDLKNFKELMLSPCSQMFDCKPVKL
jgi:hypothetical protein